MSQASIQFDMLQWGGGVNESGYLTLNEVFFNLKKDWIWENIYITTFNKELASRYQVTKQKTDFYWLGYFSFYTLTLISKYLSSDFCVQGADCPCLDAYRYV